VVIGDDQAQPMQAARPERAQDSVQNASVSTSPRSRPITSRRPVQRPRPQLLDKLDKLAAQPTDAVLVHALDAELLDRPIDFLVDTPFDVLADPRLPTPWAGRCVTRSGDRSPRPAPVSCATSPLIGLVEKPDELGRHGGGTYFSPTTRRQLHHFYRHDRSSISSRYAPSFGAGLDTGGRLAGGTVYRPPLHAR
jgi:hypothetical protein